MARLDSRRMVFGSPNQAICDVYLSKIGGLTKSLGSDR